MLEFSPIYAILIIFSGIILVPFVPFITRLLGKTSSWALSLIPLSNFLFLILHWQKITSGEVVSINKIWMPNLGLQWSFLIDGTSLIFGLLISGIGFLIVLYGGAYFKKTNELKRFNTLILLFFSSMQALVLADNLLLLFICWELTSITSYLLIGFNHESATSRKSALRALLVTGAGGMALLAGIILLNALSGQTEISQLAQKSAFIRQSSLYPVIVILIMLGAFTKSAQFPFHFWLPGAMAAPTPVSAYLHSATMVKAGIYLLLRLNSTLGGSALWQNSLLIIGAITMIMGAVIALAQYDLKKLLAFTTISALGVLIFLLGIGSSQAIQAFFIFLIVHAFYKGTLFMVTGIIDKQTGSRDIRKIGQLFQSMPITALAAIFAAFSMAGIPPLLGFVAKELMYESSLHDLNYSTWFTVLLIITNALTVAAAIIVGYGIFFQRKEKEAIQLKAEVKETQFQMYFGPCILAISSLVCGFFVYSFSKNLIPSAISSIGLTEKVSALKLWHGFNFILLLSLITLLLGFFLWVKRSFFLNWGKAWVNFVQRVGPTGLYDLALEGLLKIARWITRVFQHGYLRNYLATIISFALLMLGLALFKHSKWPIKLFQFNILNLLFVVLVLVLVARMVVARSRLNLLVHMGCIGLSITLIFAVYSAPDLALTQALIEILTVLLFVLAVYRLPKFRSFSSWKSKLRDALLAVGMGTVFVIMLMQIAHQSQEPISEYFAKNSYLEAFGKNVVNVILVDFRAFDTLGEITVVAMAGMGIFALLKKAPK